MMYPNTQRYRRMRLLPVSFAAVIVACLAGLAIADGELDRRASWELVDDSNVSNQVANWLKSQELEDGILKSTDAIWDKPAEGQVASDILQRAVATFAAVDKGVAALVAECRSPASNGDLPDLGLLENEELDPLVRNNLRLYIGKWFAVSGMYNECLEILKPLGIEEVAAPESLLFYRGVAHYRLRGKEDGLKSLEKLLENKDNLPKRYTALAELMQADLEALEVDSLDEVARIMDSVRVRLALGRAGTRVRKEEDEIIEKLDKKIEELEKKLQEQQQQQQQGGSAKGKQSNNPANDSSLPGAKGSPEVDPKRLASETEWGDLPPKAREEALQSLGKEFPSHYREVIEEYFRKIAREEVETP